MSIWGKIKSSLGFGGNDDAAAKFTGKSGLLHFSENSARMDTGAIGHASRETAKVAVKTTVEFADAATDQVVKATKATGAAIESGAKMTAAAIEKGYLKSVELNDRFSEAGAQAINATIKTAAEVGSEIKSNVKQTIKQTAADLKEVKADLKALPENVAEKLANVQDAAKKAVAGTRDSMGGALNNGSQTLRQEVNDKAAQMADHGKNRTRDSIITMDLHDTKTHQVQTHAGAAQEKAAGKLSWLGEKAANAVKKLGHAISSSGTTHSKTDIISLNLSAPSTPVPAKAPTAAKEAVAVR